MEQSFVLAITSLIFLLSTVEGLVCKVCSYYYRKGDDRSCHTSVNMLPSVVCPSPDQRFCTKEIVRLADLYRRINRNCSRIDPGNYCTDDKLDGSHVIRCMLSCDHDECNSAVNKRKTIYWLIFLLTISAIIRICTAHR